MGPNDVEVESTSVPNEMSATPAIRSPLKFKCFFHISEYRFSNRKVKLLTTGLQISRLAFKLIDTSVNIGR
jgi:hypothetical protein